MASSGDKLCQMNDQSLREQVESPQVSNPLPPEQSQVQIPNVNPGSQKILHGCGGHDCAFHSPPPEAVQTECAICLQVLREPHLISCCGHNFCKSCISCVKMDGKSCPLCKAADFGLMHNKGLERSLNEFDVRCTHAKSGCEWVDKLCRLDHHLNVNPSSDKQPEGCGFVEVECMYNCGGYFQRHLLANHQGEECPKRPYSCDHCQDYASCFDDVTNSHWPECKCYPLSCPNHCTPYTIERQNLKHHVSEDCPLTVVNCDFHYAGCELQLPRKDMPTHLAENLVAHLSQLAARNQKLIDIKDKEINELRQELKHIRMHVGIIPLLITVPDFETTAVMEWYSQPFYTCPGGYKMCLRVDGNGSDKGRGTHISVFTLLMRGDFDDHLKWPFLCDITIQLLNQEDDEQHHERILEFGARRDDDALRVTKGERAEGGWGRWDFISLTDFDRHRDEYLKDGCIRFQITKVQLKN